ncbi:MAG: Ig-like domain repeat protein, partial [Bacteroidota bacterium]|nr:Ig-like domain repeat protein [Bacteroidota bacterium]
SNNAAVRDFNTATPNAPITVGTQPPTDWFLTEDFNNAIYENYMDVGLDAGIYDLGAPVLTAPSGLQEQARWDNTPAAGEFFDQVDYIGAFGSEDWTAGWVEWNPVVAEYR